VFKIIATAVLSVALLSPVCSTKKVFEEKIKSPKQTYVVFGADWCEPCVKLKRLLKEVEIAKKIVFLDASKPWVADILTKLEYRGIPYTVVYKDGKPTGVVRFGLPDSLIFLIANVDPS
jgi:thiol-disulfide isomerase/thioredoxin